MKKTFRLHFIFNAALILVLTGSLFVAAATEKGNRDVIDLKAETMAKGLDISFASSSGQQLQSEIFTLSNPPRLVIDIYNTDIGQYPEDLDQLLQQHTGYNGWRYSKRADGSRIVFDTEYDNLPPFTQQEQGKRLGIQLKEAGSEAVKRENVQHPDRKTAKISDHLPITVDFKGTDIQNVFRFLAEIRQLNVVMGDDVSGTVTLRLKKVPWRQVMDIVLKTQRLGMEQTGNVMRIAPLEVFKQEEQDRQEIMRKIAEQRKTKEEIQPLVMKILKVNFADIDEVADKIDSTILSERGNVETDPRTNSLIINDIEERITRAEALLAELDEPVRQVIIEAKIVKIEKKSAFELGVQWGGAWGKTSDDRYYGVSGNNDLGSTGLPSVNDGSTSPEISSSNAVNLPAGGLTSGLGLIFGKIDQYNLNVKLSAMQGRGDAHILSSPKVLALNQHSARIGQGQEIPYQTTSDEGTTTEFKKAELSLEVTPTITNNAMVSMEVVVSKDSKGENTPDGPAINTQTITTSLLLKDGETAVVGGIIESSRTNDNDSVPVLGRIPLLGWLFKHDYKDKEQTELMIFITPRIIK